MQGSVLSIIFLFVISVLSPISGIAADLSWRPRVETGALYYKFEDENAVRVRQNALFAQEGIEVKSWLPFVEGGVTVFVDRFFIDGYAQYAFDGSDRFDQALASAGTTTPLTTEFTNNKADIDRLEYAISLGYSVADETALYLGVKGARTKFDVNSTGEQFSAGSSAGTFNQNLDLKFSYIGPFVGATQAWNVNNGTFTANVGVAFLWSKFEQSVDGTSSPDIDGDTIGLNFGVAWIGLTPVDQLTYTVGIKGYKYDFEADEAEVGDTKETAVSFGAGLAYAF